MNRPFRVLATLSLLTSISFGIPGCGGGGQGIDEEIDAGGYAPGDEDVTVEPVAGGEDSAPAPAPVDATEPTP